MGSEKQSTSAQQTQQTQYQPTPEETELNKLMLERQKAAQGGTIEAQGQGLNLINQLLSGQQLPGYLQTAAQGISPEAIGTQASQLARQYGAGFQQQGLAESGTAFKETAKGIGENLLFPAEQFNIGALQNLLNLALGGQAQVQAPITQQGGQLSQALAGLRSVSSSGTQIGQGQTQYDFFTSPFTGAMMGGAAGSLGMGSEAYGKALWG